MTYHFSNRISGCLPAAVSVLGLTIAFAASTFPALAASRSPALAESNGNEGNPGVLPPDSDSHGSTYAEWSAKWWQWVLPIAAAQNPILDPSGADCAAHQSGPVWFLAGTNGPPRDRSCTVPAGVAIFFPIVNVENDYPCPDPSFQPTPGQSLQDFLTNGNASFLGARQYINPVTGLEVEVDQVKLRNLFDYRATSTLFYFTGDPSLTSTFDSCITGSRQPAVSDGYWIMHTPLSRGQHTIHFSAKAGSVVVQDVTYHLTVAGSHEGDR